MLQQLAGRGEMAERARAFPWSDTPLGPIHTWPVSLRSSAALMLESRFPMALWWGPDLRSLYNDAYVPVLAGKHPDALGRPASEVWPEIWHILGPQSRSVLEGRGATWNEHLLLPMQRKGFLEETYFTFSYSPLRDDDGRIDGVLITCQETTAQVQGERQLRLLRALAAGMADERSSSQVCRAAAAVFEEHGADVPFALLYLVDESGEWRHGGAAGFGERPVDAARDALATLVRTQIAAEPAGAGPVVIELPTPLADLPRGPWDGAPRHAAVVALQAGPGVRPLGYLVTGLSPVREITHAYTQLFALAADQIARALTAARAFEEERRRAEALSEIDRQKSAFFSNISHEFRTPLTLMIGPTEDALAAPSPALRGADLEAVYRNELRLLRLVNTLLDFARLEAGRMVPSYEPTDLVQYTTDLASMFRSAFERAGLRFSVECEAIDDEVFVDRGMWEKVVLNLLSNALKFTFDGSVTLRLTSAGDALQLVVQDTGIGIAADDLPHIFERFHRVEGAMARTHEGSGIGLALVNDLVRLHGGTCAVTSAPGSGTAVTVSVPSGSSHLPHERVRTRRGPVTTTTLNPFVSEALRWLPDDRTLLPVDEQVPTEEREDSLPKAHLLVVDDNADMRDYLTRLLSRYWSVETADDGLDALDAVRRRRPDLVLTDVMMPRLDGFALLRALRADSATAGVPVIMLSARAGEEARVDGVHAGADEYLVKPFSARELIARVSAQLRLADAAREKADLLAREHAARQEAEFQRRQLRAVFDQAPTLTAVLRGPDLVVELANDRICAAWGRTQQEMLGQPFFEAIPEARDQVWRSILEGVYGRGEPHIGREMAAQFVRDGQLQTSYYDFVWTPLRDGARTAGVIVVATDVTEQVLARRQLSDLREVAEAANRAKDEFLAMLGHELRNPLAPIVTALQLLKLRGVEAGARERAIIERQVRHLVSLVDDLLDISRITRGKLELKRTHAELGEVVSKAIEMASPLLELQRHAVHVDVPSSGLPVHADPNRIAQVVANLVNNAAKYTEPGGRIDVRAGLEDGWVVLQVRDSGVGIAAEMLPQVFDLFVQERQTSARSRGGLGLGLTIVRSLVTLHGGSVTAFSEGEGRGATFTIRLPLDLAPAADLALPVASDSGDVSTGPLAVRVLVVDDNVDAGELLAEILTGFGCTVVAVHDGPSALSLAGTFRPDVALLDIGLPVMDGYELARRLRSLDGLEQICLVAVTGYGQLQDRERSVDAGFGAHLVKPLDATELRAMLARLSQESSPDRSGSRDVPRHGSASAGDAPVADRA